VAVIAVLQAITSPAVGVTIILSETPFGVALKSEAVSDLLSTAVTVLGWVVAFGLWRMERWAWIATMIWYGVTMAGLLIAWTHDDLNAYEYGLMVISVVAVFYLNQRDVQAAFHHRHEPPSETVPA
jgi:hypothetical protein